MYGDYFRHLLIPNVHEHFPRLERPLRQTIEDDEGFISVIREGQINVRVDSCLLKEMKMKFLEYLKRRSGSIKTVIIPCSGTVGRWNKRRSATPIMELNYACYDKIYYRNWIESDVLDRITWSNVLPILVTRSYCPCGSKNGIIFIID